VSLLSGNQIVTFATPMQKLKVPRYIQWIFLTGIIFLFLMTVLRLMVTLFFPTQGFSFSSLLPSFVLGIRYDLRIICIVSLILFLLGSLRFLHPLNKKTGRRVALLLWTVFILVFIFFYLIDFTNYAYLSQRMNANLLNYLEDAGISFKMMWQSYPVIWMIIGILGGAALLIWIVKSTYNHVLSKPIVATNRSKIGWGIAFFLLLAIGIFGRVGQYPLRWSDAYGLGNDYEANLALNPFQSFFSSLKFRHSSFDAKKLKEGYGWMSQYLGVDKPDSSSFSFERSFAAKPIVNAPQNVVVVICESFSGYKSSMYGNPLNTTPYFAELTKQGLFYDRCFTPHYGTARGVWATITGVPDVSLTKTASRNPAAVDQRTIINDFKDKEKFYFLGGSTSWANIRGLLTNNIHGLHLYEEGDFKAPKIDVWGISDKNLFLEANEVLAKQQKPFFAVIQTAGNHRPYTIPEEDLKEFQKKDIPQDSLVKFGFASVEEYNAFRYTDYTFKKFMETAAKEKYYENTLFVFVGDHGIRGDAGNMFPRSWTEQGLTTVHVPLLFYYPKSLQPQRLNIPASQLDIMPTIAAICGIPYTNTGIGVDLTSANQPKYAFIMDPDVRQIGVVDSLYYYNYKLNSGQESITYLNSNQPVQADRNMLNRYKTITNAFYESSRYLLLNNKKKK
jgi:phosphoglycerol transferase MdoB-like AlkP superfamily enzyme